MCFEFLLGLGNLFAQSRKPGHPDKRIQNLLKPKQSVESVDSIDVSSSTAQNAATLLDQDGKIITIPDSVTMYVWKVDMNFGDRIVVPYDTATVNFSHSTTAEAEGLGVAFLGNIGSPTEPIEFSKRTSNPNFPFMNGIIPWQLSAKKNIFYNTKVPYSNVEYQTGGGGNTSESRLQTVLTSNFGKKFNLGLNVDYIYARGYYEALFNKQISYDVFASYISDRYKLHVFVGNNNSNSSTNGGIIEDRYITNPESEDLQSIRGNSKDIPVVFTDGIRNKLRGRNIFVSNAYDLGQYYEEVAETDTTTIWKKKKGYIAPASIIYTLNYEDQRRSLFTPSESLNNSRIDSVFVPNVASEDLLGGDEIWGKYSGVFNDYMSYYSLKNTLAFRMNEGFRAWTKFGLTAFIEADIRKYLIAEDQFQYLNHTESDNLFSFGAKLSNTRGKYLRYNIYFSKGLNKSNLELSGDVVTQFSLLGKDISLKALAYIKNTPPGFFQENFSSRNWVYHNRFSDEKRVYIGGELSLPKWKFSETLISGSYENVSNYIYIQDVAIPESEQVQGWSKFRRAQMQYSGNVNLFALKLKQKFTAGLFNLELQGLLQKTTNEDVIPLPLWTVSANVYLLTKISRVLTVQIGVDSYMYDSYYARAYDPLFNQFYNQNKDNNPVELGNFLFTNAYINFHLKYTRFFIMGYNIAQKMGNRKSFTTPHYPIDPFMVRWGVSWRFNN